MSRPTSSVIALAALVLAVIAATPPTARAADYWVTLTGSEGEIAQGVNGFSWHTYGGSFNTYGAHCDANPGAHFVAGAYCLLRFNVPAGLSAPGGGGGGGLARGTYRVGNSEFILRTSRPGGAPDYVSDAGAARATHGPYEHGWGALGGYVETGIRTGVATTTAGSINTWFHHDTFTVLLRDPTAPVIQMVQVDGASASGWFGPGCHAARYAWADDGSQLWAMQLAEHGGGVVHAWAAAPGRDVVASGVPNLTQSTCLGSGSSGARGYRTQATDRSGNVQVYDFTIHYDVTPPSLGAPTHAGAALADGASFGSASGYRPTIVVPASDAHSGLASVAVTFAGVPVAHRIEGGAVVVAPATPLPLGTHQLVVRVVDGVGLASTVTRTITIRDDAPPSLTVGRAFVAHANSPLLDLEVTDDRSGVVATSWRVDVNGQPLDVTGTATGLRAALGMLVDGQHEVSVTVRDGSGNLAIARYPHVADGAAVVPQLAGATLSGIHVYDRPTTSTAGATHRVRAVIARHGRPVAGRAELRRGASTVGFRDIEPDGTVDLGVTINDVQSQLAVHAPDGVGLAPASFTVACPRCATDDPRPDQPAVDPAGNGTVGPTTNSPQAITPTQAAAQDASLTTGLAGIVAAVAQGGPGSAAAASTCSVVYLGGCRNGYPPNVIYYVGKVPYWNGIPLAESGAPLDKAAPQWKLKPIHRRAGTLRRTRSLALQLWTNELAVLSITPTGGTRMTSVGVRRRWRTITVNWTAKSALGRRVAAARAGTPIVLRLRVTATDRNQNRSAPRWVTIRTRA